VTLRARLLLLAAAAFAAAGPLPAATLVRDLGQGLTYYRVHDIPQDQPSPGPAMRPGACVLDLRYAKADEMGASVLKDWVMLNVSARTPFFILENAQTDPALLAVLPAKGPPGLVVLAPASARIAPAIAVQVSPEDDRKAYDALEKGADVQALLSDYPDKPRIDEAYLEKEHIADSDSPGIPTDKPLPPRPLVDAMLQRAVQLYRGLTALKKLQP
jgi:hypothetical protein